MNGAPVTVTIVAHHVGGIGGMEQQLEQLVQGLLRRGHSVTLVARRCTLPAHSRLRVHRVPGPFRPFLLGYLWFAIAGSVIVARHRDGIVHTTGALVLNRAEVSTVHFVHRATPLRTLLAGPSEGAIKFVNCVCATAVSRAGERLAYRASRTRRLVAVSAGTSRDVTAAGWSRVCVIPNGVDTDRFCPDAESRRDVRRSLGIRNDALVAVFVGGDWERKGVGIAIESLALSSLWTLIIVGAGDVRTYQSLASRCEVADRVRFVGLHSEPERFMQAADAFVYPSRYEALPLVLLEAASCGLPLVVPNINGVDELLVNGRNGRLCARNPGGVADALAWLDNIGSDGRRRLGEEGRDLTLSFTWSSVVDQYEALYRTLSARR